MENYEALMKRVNIIYKNRGKIYTSQSDKNIVEDYANTVLKMQTTKELNDATVENKRRTVVRFNLESEDEDYMLADADDTFLDAFTNDGNLAGSHDDAGVNVQREGTGINDVFDLEGKTKDLEVNVIIESLKQKGINEDLLPERRNGSSGSRGRHKDFDLEGVNKNLELEGTNTNMQLQRRNEDLDLDRVTGDVHLERRNEYLELELRSEDLKQEGRVENLKLKGRSKDLELDRRSKHFEMNRRIKDFKPEDINGLQDANEDMELKETNDDLNFEEISRDSKIERMNGAQSLKERSEVLVEMEKEKSNVKECLDHFTETFVVIPSKERKNKNKKRCQRRYITSCLISLVTNDQTAHKNKPYLIIKDDEIARRCLPVFSTAEKHNLPFPVSRLFVNLDRVNVKVSCQDESKRNFALKEVHDQMTHKSNDIDDDNNNNERVQQAIIDGMTKYAEQKFGRKRKAPSSGKARNAMDDYEIYLRSLKAKIKTSQDRVNVVLKQKKEIDEKLKKAEDEKAKHEKTLREAEEEKENAEMEGRDPKLPSGFVVPQTAKKAAAGSGFANLVMKASAQLWEDKFMAMRAKKGGSDGQPEWMNKNKSRDKVLVNVGKKPGHKKEEEHKPAWGANLKKSEPRRRVGDSKAEDSSQPAFAKVGLRKTQRKEDDDETGSKKVDWKEQMVKKPGAASSRRSRGGDDSD